MPAEKKAMGGKDLHPVKSGLLGSRPQPGRKPGPLLENPQGSFFLPGFLKDMSRRRRELNDDLAPSFMNGPGQGLKSGNKCVFINPELPFGMFSFRKDKTVSGDHPAPLRPRPTGRRVPPSPGVQPPSSSANLPKWLPGQSGFLVCSPLIAVGSNKEFMAF